MKKTCWFLGLVLFLVFCTADYVEAAGFTKHKHGLEFLDGKFKFGGRLRLREEAQSDYYVTHLNGQARYDDDFLLFQTRIYGEFRPTEDVGVHLMFEDAQDWNEPHPFGAPHCPYAKDTPWDVQQAYLFYEPEKGPFCMWAGRREVFYLKHRLIGTTLGWGNKVIAYDGAMATFKNERFSFDLSYLNRVSPEHSSRSFEHDWFEGPADTYVGWLTIKGPYPGGDIDVYTIYDDQDDGEDIYTLGLHAYGGIGKILSYDTNVCLQFGDALVGATYQDRRAGAFYIDIWHTFDMPWKPTAGIEYFMATGDDDPNSGDYKTFDQLYATPHYSYGYMDLFGWQNMHDLSFKGTILPFKDFKFSTQFHTFWLYANEDKWFCAYKVPNRWDPTGNASHYVGNELDFIFFYDFLKHFTLMGTYCHFFPGDYVAYTGHSDDADFMCFELRFEF